MTTQHDKTKRWQFGLRELLIVVTIAPVMIGLVFGAFGEAAQVLMLYFLLGLVLAVLLVLSGVTLMFGIGISGYIILTSLERLSRARHHAPYD